MRNKFIFLLGMVPGQIVFINAVNESEHKTQFDVHVKESKVHTIPRKLVFLSQSCVKLMSYKSGFYFNFKDSILGEIQNSPSSGSRIIPCVVEGIEDKLWKKELLGIFVMLPHYQQWSITSFTFAPNIKQKVENVQVPAPTLPSFSFVTNIKSGILKG